MNDFDTKSLEELNKMQQIEEMKRALLGRILTKEAFERLSRVRIANPQLAAQAELYLLNIYQSGRLKQMVPDDKLKEVLKALSEGKRDFNIRRR
jgi:DNA-binding TFAR19-related protein (PDSD5 family)